MRFQPKILVLIAVIGIVVLAYVSGWGDFFSLEFLQAQQMELRLWVAKSAFLAMFAYFTLYVLLTALSLPGAAVLTLAGGALFGFSRGLLLVSFASSLGATLAFLLARYLLREMVEKKMGQKFRQIQEGFEQEGAGYLAFLRLVPIFPFFIVNILAGLTQIPALKFYLVSQLAMLPGTAIFVNAGTELSKVNSLSEILSTPLLISLFLMGVFPLLAKKAGNFWRQKHASRR